MSRYGDTITDEATGAKIPGVSVYVYKYADESLATLTADGGGPLANPVTSDQYGNYSFNAADGLYILEYHFGGRRILRREQVSVGPGPVLPAEILAALATSTGAAQIGTASGGTVASQLAGSVTVDTLGVSPSNTAAANTAALKAGVDATPRTINSVGVRHINAPKGVVEFSPGEQKVGSTPATGLVLAGINGLTIEGEQAIATYWFANASGTQHLIHFGPGYEYIKLANISLANTGTRAQTVAVRLDPNGAGGKARFENISVSGWDTVVQIFDPTAPYEGGDTTLIDGGSGIDFNRLFSVESSLQAVCNHITNGNWIADEELYYSNGSSETWITFTFQAVKKWVVRFGPNSGGSAGYVHLIACKFEYHSATARLLKAEQTVSGEDNTLLLRGINFSGGQAVPVDMDAHRIMDIDGSPVRIDCSGGYLRGEIRYRSVTLQPTMRWSFRYMEAAPKPENVLIEGFSDSATHAVMEWRHNENVPVDQYRGGQRGSYSIDPWKMYCVHPFGNYLINTGVGATPGPDQQTVFSGRVGRNWTITGLPAGMNIRHIYVFILADDTADTRVDVWADDGTFVDANIINSVTITGGSVRRLVRVTPAAAEIRQASAGSVFLRITKPATGQFTRGYVAVEYYSHVG